MEFRVSKSIFLSFDYSFFTGQISYHPDFLYLSGRDTKKAEKNTGCCLSVKTVNGKSLTVENWV